MDVSFPGLRPMRYGDVKPGTIFLVATTWYLKDDVGMMVSMVDGRRFGQSDDNFVMVPLEDNVTIAWRAA